MERNLKVCVEVQNNEKYVAWAKCIAAGAQGAVIPKAPNYRKCKETKKQYLGIPKNRYQVQFISVVNLNLFVWFMKVKPYKVESCTVYFSLNFHTNL